MWERSKEVRFRNWSFLFRLPVLVTHCILRDVHLGDKERREISASGISDVAPSISHTAGIRFNIKFQIAIVNITVGKSSMHW